jgi:DNA-binding response OmpR family regulator
LWQLTRSLRCGSQTGHVRRFPSTVQATGSNVNPKRAVVILEDDPPIRSLLERWLGEVGYRVVDAAAGQIAPALVIANVPDPQAAQAVVRTLQAYAAPILLLSARFHSGLGRSPAAARRLGVKKVLPKPFSRKDLLAAVREAVAP